MERYFQFARYAVVGVIHNVIGYLVYLYITWLGLDPKISITILYPIGFAISYIGNKKWTFSHEGSNKQAAFRFILAHVIGYLINLMLLYVLVDLYGYPHQYVQILAISILVFYFFIALKLYVFSVRAAASEN